jgi:hypothetical protein
MKSNFIISNFRNLRHDALRMKFHLHTSTHPAQHKQTFITALYNSTNSQSNKLLIASYKVPSSSFKSQSAVRLAPLYTYTVAYESKKCIQSLSVPCSLSQRAEQAPHSSPTGGSSKTDQPQAFDQNQGYD